MTTITTAPPELHASPARTRLAGIIRLHFANRMTLIGTPLIVLALIMLVNLVILALIGAAVTDAGDRADARAGFGWSGASFYLFAYMAIAAMQAMSSTFRFAQGFGATRRDYYLGSALTFVMVAVGYTARYAVLGAVESATDGFGVGSRVFTPYYFGSGAGDRTIIVLCLFLLFLFVGAGAATVWVRWKGTGMVVLWGGIAVLAVGLLAVAVLTIGWAAIFETVGSIGTVGFALLSLIPTAVFGIAGYLVLRRATPQG